MPYSSSVTLLTFHEGGPLSTACRSYAFLALQARNDDDDDTHDKTKQPIHRNRKKQTDVIEIQHIVMCLGAQMQ